MKSIQATSSKSKFDESLLERIRAAVPIGRLAGSSKTRIRCPFHHSNDEDVALNHNNDTWYCFGKCGTGGDIFKWVKMEQPGMSFPDIVRHLANLGNIPTKPPTKRIEILTSAMVDYRENLQYSKEAKEFLLSRGIREETWFKANIGYAMGIPGNVNLLDLKSVGLVYEDSGAPYFENRIIFAIHDKDCNIVHLQGRTIGLDYRSERKYLQLPKDTSLGVFPISHYLYGEDQLLGNVDLAFLCEGIPDSLIVRQMGFASFGTIGNQGFHAHAYKMRKVKRLYDLMDNDEASQKKVISELAKIQAKLPDTEVFHVVLPKDPGEPKMDVNEWYLKYKPTPEQFIEMVNANATPAMQSIIDEWGSNYAYHQQLLEVISCTPDPERWIYYLSRKFDIPKVCLDYGVSLVTGKDRSSIVYAN